MFKIILASSVIVLSISLFGISNELLAAAPKENETGRVDSKMLAEKKASTLQVRFKDDKFTIESNNATLEDLLKSVTERIGVTFNITEETAKHDQLRVKLVKTPSSEAIKTILSDYNTLYVWDEHMKLLQVNVLGRVTANETSSEIAEESVTAKNATISSSDPDKIENALKDVRSNDPLQQETALNDLIGGDDPRIAKAILDVALDQAKVVHGTAREIDKFNLSSKAALSLWRHGVERGFADQETIDALKTLEVQGNPTISGIAKQALQDLNRNF